MQFSEKFFAFRMSDEQNKHLEVALKTTGLDKLTAILI